MSLCDALKGPKKIVPNMSPWIEMNLSRPLLAHSFATFAGQGAVMSACVKGSQLVLVVKEY